MILNNQFEFQLVISYRKPGFKNKDFFMFNKNQIWYGEFTKNPPHPLTKRKSILEYHKLKFLYFYNGSKLCSNIKSI